MFLRIDNFQTNNLLIFVITKVYEGTPNFLNFFFNLSKFSEEIDFFFNFRKFLKLIFSSFSFKIPALRGGQ